MPDSTQPAEPTGLRGIAMHVTEQPTGLRTTCARIAATDLPRVRAFVDEARVHGLTLTGGWQDLLVVWGAPGGRMVPEMLTADPGDVAELRDLLLELNQ